MRYIGACPICGSENIEVCWIGTCTQKISAWESDNPAWAKQPIYEELSEWNMEWEDEIPFICIDCENLFDYDEIIFEEKK